MVFYAPPHPTPPPRKKKKKKKKKNRRKRKRREPFTPSVDLFTFYKWVLGANSLSSIKPLVFTV